MIQNKDPLQPVGNRGRGNLYIDRDYSQFIQRPSIKSVLLAALILFYIGIVMCVWMIGLKFLAIALAIITISIVLVGTFIASKLDYPRFILGRPVIIEEDGSHNHTPGDGATPLQEEYRHPSPYSSPDNDPVPDRKPCRRRSPRPNLSPITAIVTILATLIHQKTEDMAIFCL